MADSAADNGQALDVLALAVEPAMLSTAPEPPQGQWEACCPAWCARGVRGLW